MNTIKYSIYLGLSVWLALAGLANTVTALGRPGADLAPPELPAACAALQPPAGHVPFFRTYALGVQIYRWNGASWSFVGPQAHLFADANFHGRVGTHYAGPTWETNSGSKVVGARRADCQPDPNAIAWLLLRATAADGPGLFSRVTFIQRVNTAGGLAPAAPGTTVGEEARVPYTTEYYFYKEAID